MTDREGALIASRLRNQWLAKPKQDRPADAVRWLGAVQSQDYAGAMWALGLRLNGVDESSIEQAFADGAILRTHILRPTWHFIAAEDFRWMLELSGPRVSAVCAGRFRQLGLDARMAKRSRAVLERELGARGELTRQELRAALERGGIATDIQRLAHLMMHAELDAVICSGPRRGRQFTYALVDARVPHGNPRTRDESLAELATRYFTSHGPATIRDFVWWSGLTTGDARRAIELAAGALSRVTAGDRTYWSSPTAARAPRPDKPSVYLLPNYDEYLIAYRDRDLVVRGGRAGNLGARGVDPFTHHLVVDGVLAGSWQRADRSTSVHATVTPYGRLGAVHVRGLEAAVERLGRFLGKAASLELTPPRKPKA